MSDTRTLTETEIYQNFMALQTKIDGLGQQVFNSSILIEFMIEKMTIAASQDDISILNITIEDYEKFHKERLEELQQQYKQMISNQIAAPGPTTAGSGPAITLDLGE